MKTLRILMLLLVLFSSSILTSCINENDEVIAPSTNTEGTVGQDPKDDNPPPGNG